jgi:probable HAF family extracellular repeat protein
MLRARVGHDTWCRMWFPHLLSPPGYKGRSFHLLISVALALSLGALSPARAADYSFTALPEAPGATHTFPYGINDASQTVPSQIVGQFTSGGAIHGYRSSDGVFIPIDFPGARFTALKGINQVGRIIGIYGLFGQGGQHGFLRDINGSFITIDVPGMTFTEPHGINADGHVAGWFADAAGRGHGFLFAGGWSTTIDAPGALDTLIYGINDSGHMVGNVNIFDGTNLLIRGFLLSGGTFKMFDVPDALETYATGITNAGQIVGWFRDATNRNRGFVRDTSGNFKPFDYPGSLGTVVHGTNNAGQIVGMFWDAQDAHGFLATPTGDCTDQVVVNNFSAQTTTGINAIIRNDTLTLFTQTNPHAPHPRVGDHGPRPGIAFTADVTINDGPIPISEIHMRYIQNLTGWNGSLVYQPKPDALLALGTSITLPILDQATQPPPAAYDNDFDETDPTGPARVVTATDSPILFAIALTLLEPVRNLQSVDVEKTFTMFLGCYADQDPTFRTLSTLDWRALYTGTVNQGSRTTFTQGADAGITAQPSVPSTQSPVQDAPLANDDGVLIQVEDPS